MVVVVVVVVVVGMPVLMAATVIVTPISAVCSVALQQPSSQAQNARCSTAVTQETTLADERNLLAVPALKKL